MTIVHCTICGSERRVSPSKALSFKYCSRDCQKIGNQRKRIPKVCHHCGKSFTVPQARNESVRHCSKACQRAAGQTVITKTCRHCKKDFQVTLSKKAKRFCSPECIKEHNIKKYEVEQVYVPHPKIRKKVIVTPLGYAALVLFCFRRRTSYQGSYRERCKVFLIMAREAGFKGSIVQALERKEPKWIEIQPDSTMITYPHHSIIS